MDNLTPDQLHILRHSLGLDRSGSGKTYRNHFATTPESDDWPHLIELCRLGLMKDHGPVEMWGGMHGFIVTEAGQKLAKEKVMMK